MVDLRAGLQNLISTKFIFAHFSTHCRTDENIVVPAEGAIVEMSLETGILQSWHSFLPPGKIPAGLYKSGNCSILTPNTPLIHISFTYSKLNMYLSKITIFGLRIKNIF